MRVLVANPQDDFRVKAYAGTNGVLLAMDLAEPRRKACSGLPSKSSRATNRGCSCSTA
jgi:hypothetical protein